MIFLKSFLFLVCFIAMGGVSWVSAEESPSFVTKLTHLKYIPQNPDAIRALDMPATFNGRDQFISLGESHIVLSNVECATLAAWVKPTDLNHDSQDIISVSTGGGNAGLNSRASLRILKGGMVAAFGRVTDGSKDASEVRSKKVLLKKDKWSHLAVALHYSESKIFIFLDGKKIETTPMNVKFLARTTPDTHSDTVVLGSEDDGSTSFFEGKMAHAGIYGRCLEDKAIAKLSADRPDKK